MKTSKPHFPTTTAHAIRLCLFQATRRPRQLRGETVKTPWGTVKIWGRLGQQHADVLEAICFVREKRGEMEDGRIKLLVDPFRIKQHARQTSGSTFASVLKELEQAVIDIVEPTHLACSGHLIDYIDRARRSDSTPITRRNPLNGGERNLWRVEIGKAFCKLVAGDIWLGYDPAAIARLEHGISQAIARHVLTHKRAPPGGWRLDTLIHDVAGDVGDTRMRHRRREVRADADKLAKIGLEINGDRVCVQQKPDSVQQKLGSVQQKPGACSKSLRLADT